MDGTSIEGLKERSAWLVEKIKETEAKLDECVGLLTEVDSLLFRVSWRILRHSKDPVAESLRNEIREFKAKL